VSDNIITVSGNICFSLIAVNWSEVCGKLSSIQPPWLKEIDNYFLNFLNFLRATLMMWDLIFAFQFEFLQFLGPMLQHNQQLVKIFAFAQRH
jgi:hypothetical protein